EGARGRRPTPKPNVTCRCHSAVAWLESTRASPNRSPPEIVTKRLPSRSDRAPQKNEPTPMAIQLMSAVTDTALRLQCIDSSSGLRKTPSEKSEPCPKATTAAAAKTTTQP